MPVGPQFQRLALMIGEDGLEAMHATEVAIFGLGGVGSWAAESLVRSGIGKVTLVDSDTVCITNVNRQLPATTRTVGRSKVQELANRFKEIHPKMTVNPIHSVYAAGDAEKFQLGKFDYVIDAIDSLTHKVDLIISAQAAGVTVFSSMGAGNKLDPTQIRIADIWDTKICPLARLVRNKLRERQFHGKVTCVYSTEPARPIQHTSVRDGSHFCVCGDQVKEATAAGMEAKDWCDSKMQINASVAHITATFGQYLASLVMNDVLRKVGKDI